MVGTLLHEINYVSTAGMSTSLKTKLSVNESKNAQQKYKIAGNSKAPPKREIQIALLASSHHATKTKKSV